MTLDPAIVAALNHPGAIDYFTPNAHRMAAFRATLDLLNIPLPEWAVRGISGRAAARRDTIAAYRADNPESLPEATARKSAAHAARIPTKATEAPASTPTMAERLAALKAPAAEDDPLNFLTA